MTKHTTYKRPHETTEQLYICQTASQYCRKNRPECEHRVPHTKIIDNGHNAPCTNMCPVSKFATCIPYTGV